MSSMTFRCPHCQSPHRQIKWGRTPAGSQRSAATTADEFTRRPRSGPAIRRRRDSKPYGSTVPDLNCRAVARSLGVHHQSVVNWLFQHSGADLPQTPVLPLSAASSAVRPSRDPAVMRTHPVALSGSGG